MDARRIIPRSSRKVLKGLERKGILYFFLGGCGVKEGVAYLLWYVHECRAGLRQGEIRCCDFGGVYGIL